MAHILQLFPYLGVAPGGQQQLFCVIMFVHGSHLPSLFCWLKVLNGTIFQNFYPQTFSFVDKTIDYGLGRIALGKNTAIFLDFERHAPSLKKCHDIHGCIFVKRAQKFLFAPGIIGDQLFWGKFTVCDIASTSPRNLDLGKYRLTPFENGNLKMWCLFSNMYGSIVS